MTPQDFRAKWGAEADAMRRRGAVVNGAAVLDEVLADFASLTQGEAEALLNLQHASQESRPNAPKIRRGDLPRKAAGLRRAQVPRSLLGATPGQIARAVVTSHPEEGR
jgi:hypothetical protein